MADSGIVKSISGVVKAIAIDGTERSLQVGDRVLSNEQIVTGDAGTIVIEFSGGIVMDLGRNSKVTLTEDALNPDKGIKQVGQTLEDAQDEVAALQQALLDGEVLDPSKLEATAAGEVPAAGDSGENDGYTIVNVDYLDPRLTPDSGFETKGISVSFTEIQEELLLQPDENNENDIPTAATTPVLLDEDDITSRQQAENYDSLRAAFENDTGFDVRSFFVVGVNDEAEGDDLPINSPTTLSGKLVADFGNDGPGNIVFNPETTQPAGITSGGEPIQYWVSTDGHSLIAYIVTEQSDQDFNLNVSNGDENTSSIIMEVAQIIFTAEITDVDSGTFRVALYGPVDQPDGATEDNLLINLGFTISDSDGESATGILALNIDDDMPVFGEEGGAIVIHDESAEAQPTVDDGDIAHDLFTFLVPENAGLPIELIGLAVNPVSSSISYSAGADGLANVALTDVNGNGFSGTPSGLNTTQGNQPIYLYSVTVELLTTIAGAFGAPLGEVANLADNMILGLTSAGVDLTNPGDSYGSFVEFIADIAFVVGLVEGDADNSLDDQLAVLQLKAIHHGNNPLDHDDEVSINKVIHLTITDSDGDTATTNNSITIIFDDDGPVAHDFQVDVTESTRPSIVDFTGHVDVGADLADDVIRIIDGPDNGTLRDSEGYAVSGGDSYVVDELSYDTENTVFQTITLGDRDGNGTLTSWGVTPGSLNGSVSMNGIVANILFIDNDTKPNSALKIYHNNDAPPNSQHIGGGSLGDNDGQGINNGEVLSVTFDKLMQYAEIGVDGLGNDFLPDSPSHNAYAHATWIAYRGTDEVARGEIDNPEGQREGFDGLQEIFTISISEGFDRIDFGNNSQYAYSNYEVRFIEAEAKVVDSFDYEVVDGDGDSMAATVDIEVTPGGDATQEIDYFVADRAQGVSDVFRFTKDSVDIARVENDIVENFDVNQDVLDLADLLSGGSYSIEGISAGTDNHLQISVKDSGGSEVQTIELNGVLAGGDPVETLNTLLDSGAIDNGIN